MGTYVDQWNTVESPEMNPSISGQWSFDKGVKTTHWAKIVFMTNGTVILCTNTNSK